MAEGPSERRRSGEQGGVENEGERGLGCGTGRRPKIQFSSKKTKTKVGKNKGFHVETRVEEGLRSLRGQKT